MLFCCKGQGYGNGAQKSAEQSPGGAERHLFAPQDVRANDGCEGPDRETSINRHSSFPLFVLCGQGPLQRLQRAQQTNQT